MYKIICHQLFIYILLSVLFCVFISLPSVSPLGRSKTQNSGTPTARTRGGCNHAWRERGTSNKRVRCIRGLQKALTNPYFRKQGATLANFMLCHRPVTRWGETPLQNFSPPPVQMCWRCFKNIAHNFENLFPSQKTLRPIWCPKLVMRLLCHQKILCP